MSEWIIKPAATLSGELTVPADKSITHRAIMFSAIAEGRSVIENYLPADDCLHTAQAFREMGVAIERTPDTLTVHGAGFGGLTPPKGTIDAGNSGTTVRLLSGILAGRDFSVTLTGDDSLSRRPMRRIIEPLERMGARFSAREGTYLPLTVQGNRALRAIRYASPVASAQVKSCILLAGLQADGETTVEEPLRSRDHTERMLAARGVDIRVAANAVSVRGKARLAPVNMRVPGDISSAAFFLVAGALAKKATVTLLNVGVNPTRDGILEVLRAMGARLTILKSEIVSGEPVADIRIETSELVASKIGASIMPRLIDEVPVLVLAATQAAGTTVISGAGELRVKESDRLKTISRELNKMGADIEEQKDGLVIHGPTPLKAADVESHGDHRIAMTLAVAALNASGETRVRNVECVDTSFPGFYAMLQKLIQA